MSHRFFLEPTPSANRLAAGDPITLEGDQAHHAINVMRFNAGDEIVLFDGSGIEYVATVDTVEKKSVLLTITSANEDSKALATEITMAVAIPKGDRQKFLIEKMVELGVQKLIPLKTKRAVAVANDKVIARLEKQVIEASKQCGRNELMEIGQPQTLSQLIQTSDGQTRLLADPYQGKPISELASSTDRKFTVAIGPEGGFDESEVELMLASEFASIRLGPAILRIETACVAVAAILGIGSES